MEVSIERLVDIVQMNPGITTPQMGWMLGVSVRMARWYVLQCGRLEFYDGNRIRIKEPTL